MSDTLELYDAIKDVCGAVDRIGTPDGLEGLKQAHGTLTAALYARGQFDPSLWRLVLSFSTVVSQYIATPREGLKGILLPFAELVESDLDEMQGFQGLKQAS